MRKRSQTLYINCMRWERKELFKKGLCRNYTWNSAFALCLVAQVMRWDLLWISCGMAIKTFRRRNFCMTKKKRGWRRLIANICGWVFLFVKKCDAPHSTFNSKLNWTISMPCEFTWHETSLSRWIHMTFVLNKIGNKSFFKCHCLNYRF